MAKQTQVLLIDDLDGGEASETVTFGIDGTAYEIDLSEVNAAKLRDAFVPYVSNARRGAGSAPRGRRRAGASPQRAMSREKSAEIRAWAKANNHPVSERGRIAASIVEAYEATH